MNIRERDRKQFSYRDATARLKVIKNMITEIVKENYEHKPITRFGGDLAPQIEFVKHSYFIKYHFNEFIFYSKSGSYNKAYVDKRLIDAIDRVLFIAEFKLDLKIDLDDLILKQKYNSMTEYQITEIDKTNELLKQVIPVFEGYLNDFKRLF